MIDRINWELAGKTCEHQTGDEWCNEPAEVIVSYHDAMGSRHKIYLCAEHGEPEAE